MSPFYTRGGDDGMTGLLGEGRVPKSDLRMETIGALDETNAVLGMARAACRSPEACDLLLKVQRDLYKIMAEVAATSEQNQRFSSIDAGRVAWIEGQIDRLEKEVQIPAEFIVPGDDTAGAFLDLARTVCRRAERRLVELFQRGDLSNHTLLEYINRLSSLCFLLEIYTIQAGGAEGPTLAKTG